MINSGSDKSDIPAGSMTRYLINGFTIKDFVFKEIKVVFSANPN